jgi:serine/threonine protein kinase
MQELIDITIGKYRIEKGLARGGMSEVYLARDQTNDQIVAMKMVRHSAGEYYERFRREARTMSTLHHSHILPALDYGDYDKWSYLVTSYIEYGTLSRRIAQGPMPLEEVENILDQLANALQFAHGKGVLHRDIKSSNVLLKDGNYAYLTDFGLVKSVQDEFSLTRSGFLVGTPEYMAPELVEDTATPASDIYALGVLVYQMATGTLPFKGPNPVSIVMKHLQEAPQPPSRLNPDITPDIEEVILQTLEKDPQRRFHTARAFANAFQQARRSDIGPLPVPEIPDISTKQVSIRVKPVQTTKYVKPLNNIEETTTPKQDSYLPTFINRKYLLVGGATLIVIILLIVLLTTLTQSADRSQQNLHPAATATAVYHPPSMFQFTPLTEISFRHQETLNIEIQKPATSLHDEHPDHEN